MTSVTIEVFTQHRKSVFGPISSVMVGPECSVTVGPMTSVIHTADDIEFYHDRNGFSHNKKELLASIQKYICGKVTRIITPGSIEVYEIPGYGAVQFGYHSFRNINEPGESHPSKFVTLWRLKNGHWQITRVISLH